MVPEIRHETDIERAAESGYIENGGDASDENGGGEGASSNGGDNVNVGIEEIAAVEVSDYK